MTTTLAVNGAAPVITADQMALITKTVAKDATPDELKLYLYDCARHGVHPLDRLLHFTKRGGKYTPVTSIDFMRTRAADSGEMAGNDDPYFNGQPEQSVPLSATVTVYRMTQGQRFAYTATARWSEYKPDAGANGNGDVMWRKMPHTMLGKCAEALALRKGFPKQLAGLYAREEMDQAGSEPVPLVEAPKRPEMVNLGTGEVTEAPLPAGLTIASCTPLTGKKAGEIKLSDGQTVTVWDARLFDVAVAICQEGTPVTVKLQPGKGTYGPSLKALSRLDAEHDQRRVDATPGDWTSDVPLPDAPF